MPTGIFGFDEIADGGLPGRGVTLVLGGPGAGKTIFGMQVLSTGVRESHEAGILVAFEESARGLSRTRVTPRGEATHRRRCLRVAKYRGASHSANEFPMTITRVGLEVATSPVEAACPASTERVSTGRRRRRL